MRHARQLLESRPFLTRVPDQSLLISDSGSGTDHVQATRAGDGSYAFVYSASGQPFVVDRSKLTGRAFSTHWYDPRTGRAHAADSVLAGGSRAFVPPTRGAGNDWVLVLDDEAREFGVPGGGGLVGESQDVK
jgi:hypothetical protein